MDDVKHVLTEDVMCTKLDKLHVKSLQKPFGNLSQTGQLEVIQ